jgi:acetyltransferase-like isoleucine patch superfamily enzyme
MIILKKIWFNRCVFRSLLYTIYFNFHYLPLKQAWRLPIFLYKPELLKMNGKVILDFPDLKMGMIKLGFRTVSLYANNGIIWENHGGIVIFRGKCSIGNASAISIGGKGKIEFGDNYVCSTSVKIVSYCSIKFGKNVRVAWEVIFMDTSFHKLKDLDGNVKGKTMVPIFIGDNNWITTRCIVMKGTKTRDYCIFGAGSVLNKDYTHYPTHSLLAGSPLEVKGTNIWRDITDDEMI